MEGLYCLLKEYNLCHEKSFQNNQWALQFCEENFPTYWKVVYSIVQKLPKDVQVIEIGSCYGYITAIFIYLKIFNIKGYEMNKICSEEGNELLYKLFGAKDIIQPCKYEYQHEIADVLVLVNCVYADNKTSKCDYIEHIKTLYSSCGFPKYFIVEVVDSSYTKEDDEFPEFLRLSKNDIIDMFPSSIIQNWVTYKYPQNKRSKTLYLIESK